MRYDDDDDDDGGASFSRTLLELLFVSVILKDLSLSGLMLLMTPLSGSFFPQTYIDSLQ